MGQRDIIALLVKLFNQYRVAYILTGSFASSYWGHPRATHDIDFVVEIDPKDKERLLSALKELGGDFEVDLASVGNAINNRWQFNIVHLDSELKIDFWVAKDNEFEKNKFKRKVFAQVFGEKVALVSAEDLILTKLTWEKQVPTGRHLRDCVGIFERQKGKLDEKYLQENSEKLSVTNLLQEARTGKYF